MEELLTHGRRVLALQSFSVLLGADLLALSAECTELKVPITDLLKQQNGFLHGGVVSYAADNALTLAGACALGPDVLTSEFKINYARPAIGDYIVARANVVHAGQRQAICRCDVFVARHGQERLCAIAQGTIARATQAPDT